MKYKYMFYIPSEKFSTQRVNLISDDKTDMSTNYRCPDTRAYINQISAKCICFPDETATITTDEFRSDLDKHKGYWNAINHLL